MGSSNGTDRVEEHRTVLRDLTGAGGAINAESNYASQHNPQWFDQETGRPLADRDREQRDVIREFRATSPNVPRDHKAILLAGPPGAGKTTAQDELFASTGTTKADWRILNADDFKDRLFKRALADGSYDSRLTPPEVSAAEAGGEKVWPRERAALVHEESSAIMKRARDQSMRQGENIIIDGTLNNADAGDKLVKRLEEQGYSVRIALVDGPRAVTEARVAYRWNRGYEGAVNGIPDPDDPDLLTLGGRWVPAEVTDALYRDGNDDSICANAAQAIAKSSTAVTQLDVYRITEPGGSPALVEQRIGKRADGRWDSIKRFGDEQRRYMSKRAEILEESTSTNSEQPVSMSGGSTPRCTVCGRPLRSAESIARGAGPTCAGAHAPSY
ncbi:zeta toxin family protein [Rathayibacter rathayi]|uniref:zeta toxin family protein n=1 Tax=Rathayibacter rathayi TaxID=33887 RepID=UPI0015E20302|nr:zeta toxin family protein [Rathayibacter rathayi]